VSGVASASHGNTNTCRLLLFSIASKLRVLRGGAFAYPTIEPSQKWGGFFYWSIHHGYETQAHEQAETQTQARLLRRT